MRVDVAVRGQPRRQFGGEAGEQVDHAAGQVGGRRAPRSARPPAAAAPRDATTTAVLPVASTGASTDTRPSSDDSCGASTADDAGRLGQREVEVRPGDRVGAAERPARTCRPSPRSRPSGRSPRRPGAAAAVRDALGRARPRSTNCARRPSSISATRYSICPRLYAVALDQPPNALRAATHRVADVLARRLRRVRQQLALAPSAPGTSVPTPSAGTRRRCRACRSCARRADAPLAGVADSVRHRGTPPGRAGRPRGRSRTPCSRRTARSGRTG